MRAWIALFASHRIAANGVMLVIIGAGLWGLSNVNNQFFPDFSFERIIVSANWDSVSAEDMYQAVAQPLQQSLTGMPEIESMTTRARDGRVDLYIAITDRAGGLEEASELIEETISTVNLPDDVNEPVVFTPQRRESVADLLLYGDVPRDELADLAYSMQSDLLQAGFAEVGLSGLPSQQIDITIPMQTLLETGLTLDAIAAAVADEYSAQPAGATNGLSQTLQLRSKNESVDLSSLLNTIVSSGDSGRVLRVGDIARVERVTEPYSAELEYEGKAAIQLSLRRTAGEDTLENAELMAQWLTEVEPTLPDSVQLKAYNQVWQTVSDQLNLLIKNGALGMVMVLVALFFFLNTRLAFWVALGIPISFLATFLFMSYTGTSLNTISLFGFMIALGIIVDDAIVVGEQTRAYQQMGMNAQEAAIRSAQKMWPPVLASSLTTIAAFVPLLLISGPIGRLAQDIPIVVTIAIIASLIECFLILPGHLSHSHHKKDRKLRQTLDAAFNKVRDQWFRPIVRWSLHNRLILIAFIIANFMIAVGMVTSRTVPFQFQPSVESPSLSVFVEFAEGVVPDKVDRFVDHLTVTLQQVEDDTGYDFIKTAVVTRNQGGRPNQARIDVELISDQDRPYTNQELVNQWRQATTLPSEIDNISFGRGRWFGGDSGDVTVLLKGDDINELKSASEALQRQLNQTTGLSDATDDLPYGEEQLQFELSSLARELGITEAGIARFMRQSLDGVSAADQVLGLQTLDVKIVLPAEQRTTLNDILSLPFRAPNGELVPLDDLIHSQYLRGIDQIRAENGEISVEVSATLDTNAMTSDDMYSLLENDVLPRFQAQYGTVEVSLSGGAQEQEAFFSDTALTLLVVLVLIFGILAWVFESWLWPWAIIATIPFGLTGAVYGHWLIDLPLSSLSVMGLFGLAGIVINDSIVLVSVYRDLREEGMALLTALEEAVARRLRPVLLTSMTTMVGLTPILFETSLDAQFLKPIAAGLVFGLLFGTTLVLLFVPALLLTIEHARTRLDQWRQRFSNRRPEISG
ncbi:efflux RND transporter permease subunit [Reinekea blandensis]|uniref:Acriflavin resistance protein n=1 Tax=Reinekea blandensis MED297 TaxID=314283 RepID=A4BHJ1_9GAMM|nr:efflux RND transporter permease subunit [Reinekea blandensis]EAR08389.1 Acriflavin resistance protein [Reinekea blandensis MED297]